MPTPMMLAHLGKMRLENVTLDKGCSQKEKAKSNDLAFAWKFWLASLAPWTHAITLTFKRIDSRQELINERIMTDAIKHFLLVLNRKCHKRTSIRNGLRIPVVTVIGWGTYKDHPHAHLCLAHPSHIDFSTFSAHIQFAADHTTWINKERDISPYRNTGWINYLVDHEPENIIFELTTAHQPAIKNAPN